MTTDDAVCAEPDCDRPAAVQLYDPRGDDRVVCAAHARVLATNDGVVADPFKDTDWP